MVATAPTLRGCWIAEGNCIDDADGDGVCDELEVAGCSDTGACNYVANATDEEACIYASEHYDCAGNCIDDEDGDGVCDQLEIPGCTALAAQNYNPLATDDDGSCTFSLEGCMDAEACNFNPIANTDTGGCVYAETHYDCNGNCLNDTDGDGVCDELETVGAPTKLLATTTPTPPTRKTALTRDLLGLQWFVHQRRGWRWRVRRIGRGFIIQSCKMVFGMSHQHGLCLHSRRRQRSLNHHDIVMVRCRIFSLGHFGWHPVGHGASDHVFRSISLRGRCPTP